MKRTLVYVAPHLSTGGLPQYLFKQIEALVDKFDVYCIEWENVTGGVLVIQRNRIQNILGDKLITLSENKEELFKVLESLKPDVIHLQEIPELFMPTHIANKLYSSSRKYVLIETSHDSSFNTKNKLFLPDKFLMVSKYQINQYRTLGIPCDLVEYPIENKVRTKSRSQALLDLGLDPNLKHVINVGLFTPRKNQAEVIEYARMLQNYPIQFHFLGNHADNFKFYWEPLMKDFPPNCKWWNERNDVDSFYEAADLFLFTSRGHATDKETMPLVIRESLSWKTPSLIYNLPVYLNYFNKFNTISYLSENKSTNAELILEKVGISSEQQVFYTLNGKERLADIQYTLSANDTTTKYGDAAGQYFATFVRKELELENALHIDNEDVFVDLGANIGMSAKYALSKGAELYCFEPDIKMLELLKKNVPSAKIFPYAISPDVNELELYHWPNNYITGGPTYKAKCITLHQVLDVVGKPIDYLKIDIEGYEEHLFDTLTLDDCTRIHKLMIEHHNYDTLDKFCDKLIGLGFDIKYIDRGFQAFIYAQNKNFNKASIMTQNKNQTNNNQVLYTTDIMNLLNTPQTKQSEPVLDFGFDSKWDLSEQKIYYSCQKRVDFPTIVTMREYKSDAILWAVENPVIDPGMEYWIIPIPKQAFSYEDDPYFTGIKLCIYNKETNEQIYEKPFFHKFVNIPTVTLSNFLPYRLNYMEFFVEKLYSKWIDKKHKLVVDVGANAGIFTEYMLRNEFAERVVAVECDSKALKDLKRNFKTHPLVTVIPKALAPTNEPITFYEFTQNPLISTTLAPELLKNHGSGLTSDKTTTVQTITLKEIISTYGHIDLLKIDIEGAEYNIILQAEDSIFENIDSFFIECHFFDADTYEQNYNAMLTRFKSLGYVVEEDKPNQLESIKITHRYSESIYAYKKKEV